ncbi:hypothetical protein JW766_03790 [Candidatus Dojkabacteria bacterium]|nr:hypothetical protein [Candidatus Dojkabacteria bacterium]
MSETELQEQPLPTSETSVFSPGREGEYCPLVNEALMKYAEAGETQRAARSLSNELLNLFFGTLGDSLKFDHFLKAIEYLRTSVLSASPQYRVAFTPDLISINFKYQTEKRGIAEAPIDPQVLVRLCEIAGSEHFLAELAKYTLEVVLFRAKFEVAVERINVICCALAESMLVEDQQSTKALFYAATGTYYMDTTTEVQLDAQHLNATTFEVHAITTLKNASQDTQDRERNIPQHILAFYNNFVLAAWGIHENTRANELSHWLDLILYKASHCLPTHELKAYDSAINSSTVQFTLGFRHYTAEQILRILSKSLFLFMESGELAQIRALELERLKGREPSQADLRNVGKLSCSVKTNPFFSIIQAKTKINFAQIGEWVMNGNIQAISDFSKSQLGTWIQSAEPAAELARRLQAKERAGQDLILIINGQTIPLVLHHPATGEVVEARELAPAELAYHAATLYRETNSQARIITMREAQCMCSYMLFSPEEIPWITQDLLPRQDIWDLPNPDWTREVPAITEHAVSQDSVTVCYRGDRLVTPDQSNIRQALDLEYVEYIAVNPKVAIGVIAVTVQYNQSQLRFLIDSDCNVYLRGELGIREALDPHNILTSSLEPYPAYWYSLLILTGLAKITSGELMKEANRRVRRGGGEPKVITFTGRRGFKRILPEGYFFTPDQYLLALAVGRDLHRINEREGGYSHGFKLATVDKDSGTIEVKRGRITYVFPAQASEHVELLPIEWHFD